VLDQDERHPAIGRERIEEAGARLQTAGGRADADDGEAEYGRRTGGTIAGPDGSSLSRSTAAKFACFLSHVEILFERRG
jgi:hypothetical protein